MPYRRLPKTDSARLKALKVLLSNKDIYIARNRFLDWRLINMAQPLHDRLLTATEQYKISLSAQVRNNKKNEAAQKRAFLYVSHFIKVLLMAVERGEIKPLYLPLYQLAETTTTIPPLKSAKNIIDWGENIIQGEKERIKKGGKPICNPAIGLVETHVDLFKQIHLSQKELQKRTHKATAAISKLRPEIDTLLLELWNAIEAHFADLSLSERLKECRQYGVVYYYRKHEARGEEIENLQRTRINDKTKAMKLLIDTHIHLDGEEYKEDLPEVVERAKAAGVAKAMIPSVGLYSLDSIIKVCEEYKDFAYPMFGLHPEEVKEDYQTVLANIKERILENPSIVAIGEVGLDFYWSREFEKQQLEAFEEQVRWSVETHLPLVIHCRKAQNELVKILNKYRKDLPGGIFHCFTGNEIEAAELLSFDKFYLGIGGVLTFKKSNLPETLRSVPLERIVLETDGPYMAPVPMRGKRNESSYLTHIAAKMAEVYGVEISKIEEQTYYNAMHVFSLDKE